MGLKGCGGTTVGVAWRVGSGVGEAILYSLSPLSELFPALPLPC